MTIVESVAALAWLIMLMPALEAGSGGVYSIAYVQAGAVLLAGLTVEHGVEQRFTQGRVTPRSAAFATLEVVAWTAGWAVIVTGGLFSRTGIGPATVVFAASLTAAHGLEGAELGERLRARHAINAVVEAVALSTAWVLLLRAGVVAAAVPLVVLLGIEHAHRHGLRLRPRR
jgi:hypothetical protein